MEKGLAQRLADERTQRYNDAARKLLEHDDVDGAKAQLNWVDTSGKVLASTKHATMLKWSVLIMFLCIVLVGLAWTLRISFSHVALDVTTGNVVFTLRQGWQSDYQFIVDRLSISHLADVKAPGLGLTAKVKPEEAMWLEFQGKDMTLNNITLQASANVELSIDGNELLLFVKNSTVSGTVNVRNAEMVVEIEDITEQRSVELAENDPPETIAFTTAATGAAPVQIRFTTRQDWRLRGLHVRALGFVEEYPPGSGNFESVIRSGSVSVLETGVEEELRHTDYLTLKDAKSRRFELVTAKDGVQVVFEGGAAQILAGPQDFAKNLTPTWFQYLKRQERLKIFWGGVLFLSGLLWRIRNTIWSS